MQYWTNFYIEISLRLLFEFKARHSVCLFIDLSCVLYNWNCQCKVSAGLENDQNSTQNGKRRTYLTPYFLVSFRGCDDSLGNKATAEASQRRNQRRPPPHDASPRVRPLLNRQRGEIDCYSFQRGSVRNAGIIISYIFYQYLGLIVSNIR